MKTCIAWHNLFHKKIRTLTIIAGISFSIFLIFMQLGFYNACKLNSTMIYDMFGFDALVVSPNYIFMDEPGNVPMHRLSQARAASGVEEVIPLYMGQTLWLNKQTGKRFLIYMLGVRCTDMPFIKNSTNSCMKKLTKLDTALIDTESHKKYGARPIGMIAELSDRKVHIVGEYKNGAGFISGGTMIVSDRTFCALFKKSRLRYPNLGLIRFSKNARPDAVLNEIKKRLPGDDAVVWTKGNLAATERHFFMKIKPIGVMFSSGVVIAFLVGAVILYQILLSDVSSHSKEYATLKAMGYTAGKLKRIIMEQSFLLICISFVPAFVLACYLYRVLRTAVKLPAYMTGGVVLFVLVLSLLMCSISGLLAIRKVIGSDPAELF